MSKSLKRMIIVIILFGLLACLVLAAVNIIMIKTVENRILTPELAADYDADCVLVLGAGVYSDGSPSPMLQDRLEGGIELYELGAAPKLLMSGDHSREDYDEVNTMKDYAMDKGVPDQDIFMDHAGFSTYDSLYRARDVFQAKKVIIVTQKYHIYRALYIADQLGLEAVGVNSDPRSYMGQLYRVGRECLARAKDFVQCLRLPEPTFLGDPIPISGDGRATNDKTVD